MKLSPGQPTEGINSPGEHQGRNIVALIAGAILLVTAFFFIVTAAVDAIVHRIDPETERELFSEMLPMMMEAFEGEGWDEEAEAALAPLFERVRAVAPQLPYNYTVRVSCMSEPNALAMPGGGIIVTKGMLQLIDTEEELAFVLGHELGHFIGRDHLRGMGRAAALQLAFGMMFFTTGVDPTIALQIGLDALSSAHSREQERKADTIGAAALAALHDGDVSGAYRTLNTMHAALDSGALAQMDFLRSHPVGADRREALETSTNDRGWHVSKAHGTPLSPVLKRECPPKEGPDTTGDTPPASEAAPP